MIEIIKTGAATLRSLLQAGPIIVAPGAYMTVASTDAGLGYPYFGPLTMTKMADNAARIVNVRGLPAIADADSRFGNEFNVYRTVQEYGRRGVAGLHIEDQQFPKKCGHLDHKQVVLLDDFLAKIRAVIAPSFSDILYNNCCKQGELPVVLDYDQIASFKCRNDSTAWTTRHSRQPDHQSCSKNRYWPSAGRPMAGRVARASR